MAERHQLKIADRHGIAADDPFAELTRIMGFDPRRPAETQAAAPEQPAQAPGLADLSAHADFDIDLEKELMGEFSAYDEPLPAAPPQAADESDDDLLLAEMRQPAHRPAEDHAAFDADMDDAVAVSLGHDLTAVEEREQPVYGPEGIESQAHGDAAPQTGDADEVAEALQGTWFGPAQDDESVTVDAAMVASAVSDDDVDPEAADFADPGEEFSAVGHADAYEAAPAHQDFAAEAAADEEATPYREPLDDDQPEAVDAYRQPMRAATDADDFDAHFDDAMADVDMDFAARPPVEAPAAALPPAGYAAYDAEAITDADLGIDDAFDRAFAVEAPAPAAMAPATEAVVTKPRESTLEDELNALLAKMTTRPAVSVASAWPKATPVAMSKESAVPETVAQAVEDDLDAALVADLHAMDLGDARMPGEDVEFDADAFHAALTEADDDAAVPAAAPRHQDAPEVETVDVPERVVALADDLDIPDVPFEDPAVGSKLYDDLENEFAGLLGQMETAPAQTHAAYDDDAYAGSFRGGAVQSQSGTFQQPAAPASASVFHPAAAGFDVDNLPGSAPVADSDPFAVDDLAYDPDDAVDVSGLAEAGAARQRPRRGLLVAGIVCAVAVAGGLGALAMSFGGKGGAEAPALVKADTAPIKVKPENPGGTVIPNQDNKVYEAVAKGIKPAAPEQQKLVTSNEEPVDVAAAAPQSRVVDLSPARPADAAAPKASEAAQAAQPGAKSEDRVQQTAQDDAAATDVPVVTPRKVRTMVVKPDGSLVPREDPAPVVAATEPTDPAPQHVVATGDQTGAVSPAKAEAGDDSALKPAKATGEVASTPKTAPIAPQRPSDQPVDVVGEVKPDKVASIDTTASTAGSWSMQIASQPTAESAQSTYQDLARRYAGILGGHDVNIVKADIAGKGTFYRVRVPTGSRNDAIKLCESYKAAGGNCFVSK